MIKVICMDDSKKPSEIPASHWVKKGTKYHITHISKMMNQGFILGCDLSEINLLDLDTPYNCFRLSRFGVQLKDLEKLQQLIKDCAELNDIEIDLDKILEEQVELI